MTQPDFERARQYALKRLQDELSPKLLYHSVKHTRDDVVPAAERLARLEGLDGPDLLVLHTAAWFHDLGYVGPHDDAAHFGDGHEDRGVEIAACVLPDFGYSQEQVEAVCALIRATRWPPTPRSVSEQVMADADMDSLGRDDFLETSAALRAELYALHGQTFSDEEWFRSQREFLLNHSYFTRAARTLRDPGKRENLARVTRLIENSRKEDTSE